MKRLLKQMAACRGATVIGSRRGTIDPTTRAAEPASVVTLGCDAASLARDLINTPSNDMGPEELALAAQDDTILEILGADSVLDFVSALTKPVVSTLHTVPHSPSPGQRRVLLGLIHASAATMPTCQQNATNPNGNRCSG